MVPSENFKFPATQTASDDLPTGRKDDKIICDPYIETVDTLDKLRFFKILYYIIRLSLLNENRRFFTSLCQLYL